MEPDYNKPHHVLLFFKTIEMIDTKHPALKEHYEYYQCLKKRGKALISGNFWKQCKSFVVLLVSSAAELEEIIDNDPALKKSLVKLVKAMPFDADLSLQL